MQTIRKILVGSIVLVTLASIATFAIPVTNPSLTEKEFHASIFTTTLFPLLHIVAAVIFILGLKDFQPRLRRAYGVICASLVLLCVAALQFPVLVIFNFVYSAWSVLGFSNLFYVLAAIVLYTGVRQFGRILDVRSIWMSPLFIGVWTTAVGLFGYWLAHSVLHNTAGPHDIAIATEFPLILLVIAAAMIVLRIKQGTGPAYASALNWFFAAIAVQGLGFLLPTIAVNIANMEGGPYLGILPAIYGMLYIRAAYIFTTISSYSGATQKTKATASISPVDVIVYVGSLASSPKDVDPILDGLREITSRVSSDSLEAKDQASLATVYNQLESYLINKDPLRVFTKGELRQKVQDKFMNGDTTKVYARFWTDAGLTSH